MTSTSTQRVIEDVRRFLGQLDVMTLATVDGRGRPYAADIYTAVGPDLSLYFISGPTTTHARHVLLDPHVSLTGHDEVQMWQRVRGVQIQGLCHAAVGEDAQRGDEIYRARFEHVNQTPSLMQRMRLYVVKPRRVRWIDNAVRFGYKVELEWPGGRVVEEPADHVASLL